MKKRVKKTALTLLKITVSLGILLYIFTSVVDIKSLWGNLKSANLLFLVAAVAVYFLVQTVSAYRWYLLLKPQGIEMRFPKVLSLYFLGMYFNFFLPSAIGGDFFRVYYLHKHTGRLSASTASVFLDRDIGMGGLLLVATVVATIAGTTVNGVLLAPIFALIGVAFLAANLAIFYRPTYNLIHRLLKAFKMKKADEKVERLFESFNSYRGRWDLIAIAVLLSIGVQVGCVFVNVLIADGIGLTTANGWIDYLVFIPTIGLLGMIPLSVNGAGWREISYILLFQSVGATADKAATLSILWVAAIVVVSLPGGIIYLRQGRSKAERPKTGEEALEKGDSLIARRADAEKYHTLSGQAREEEPVSTM
jgi:uncharacterized protein (TIRG00374 family)